MDPGLLCYLDGAHLGVLHHALEERFLLTVYYADASSSSGKPGQLSRRWGILCAGCVPLS